MIKTKITTAKKWLFGIGGTILLGLITNVIDRKVNYSKITEWFITRTVSFFRGVVSFLNYPVKLWVVLIIIVAISLILIFGIRYLIRSASTASTAAVDFLNYKSDLFGIDNQKWSWEYSSDNYIVNLAPNCRVCKAKMELQRYSTGFQERDAHCPKCRLNGKKFDWEVWQNQDDVEKEIIRKIADNEYPQNVPTK